MKNKIIIIVSIIFLVAAAGICPAQTTAPSGDKAAKIKLVATLFPLYDFAKNIGQDRVEVTLLLPPGVEAHSFEPKPSDIVKITQADILVYTGKFMEPWVEKLVQGINNPKLKVVDASKGIVLRPGDEDEDEHKHAAAKGPAKEHHHDHHGVDPHIWLDFDNAAQMVATLTDSLMQVDPNRGDFYSQHAKIYQEKLRSMDNRYKTELAQCPQKVIIHAGHFTFGYPARRYHLKYVAAQGFTPDSEPTPKQLISLVKQINKYGLKHVYYEELVEPRVAKTISQETGATLLMLHGAHNISKEELAKGISFLAIMEDNLANLKTGLQCQK
jgi:zinc transport system substrate-binding protein